MDFIKNIYQKMNEVFETDAASFYKSLIDMTSAFDGEIYLVGGAVRDKLMGNNDPKDHDFVVTKVDLDELAKLLEKFIVIEKTINLINKKNIPN